MSSVFLLLIVQCTESIILMQFQTLGIYAFTLGGPHALLIIVHQPLHLFGNASTACTLHV